MAPLFTTSATARNRPRSTAAVQQHAATFFAQAEDAAGADLPQFVKDEFDAFLECGILAHGFLRLRCGDCGHDKLVAFTCKRRGFCPSCGAGRMAQTAADRRGASDGVAHDHHPHDASCSPVGGCWLKRRVRPPWPTTTAIRTRPARSGRCRLRRGLAGRAGPVARPFAKRKQSTGLFVSGLSLPHRLRSARGAEGADAAGS